MNSFVNFFQDIIQNPLFLSAGASWLVAQGSKTIYEGVKNGFSLKRAAGGGGMPSAHSATMTGLVGGALLSGSAKSPEFAVALFLAMVVIYDAMGVRHTTGVQSKILNAYRRRDLEEGRQPLFDEELDEKMGHTLPEVIVGILIGAVMAAVMCLAVYPWILELF